MYILILITSLTEGDTPLQSVGAARGTFFHALLKIHLYKFLLFHLKTILNSAAILFAIVMKDDVKALNNDVIV